MSDLTVNKNNSFMEVTITFLKSLALVVFVYVFEDIYVYGAELLYIDFPKFSSYLLDIKDVVSCLTAIGALILVIVKIRNELKNKDN